MDVFMKNKALYLDFNKTKHYDLSESRRNATIDYLYFIRKNIDIACTTKNMLAHTMISYYRRNQVIPTVQIFQFCSHFALDFKRMCGSDLSHFELFLRHFPLAFRVKNGTVSLRSLDLNELKRRYKAIIRKPKHLFEDGKLPKGLESSFNVTLVEDAVQGDRIAKVIYLNHPRVAIDLEGYNLGLNGLITLCQVAVSSDRVYLFDILKCPYFLKKGVLRRVLQSPKITKVLHGISGDAANLYRQFNITLKNVYDTQAAFKGLQMRFPELRMGYDGEELGGSWKISLNELMALYKFDTNQIKGAVKSLYKGNPNLWSYRPLCPALLHYAGEDVNMLLKLQDAINNHPFFKPDSNETIYQTDKVIRQQIKAADTLANPWVFPECPRPRSVIRGRPSTLSRAEREKLRAARNTTVRSKRAVADDPVPLPPSYVIIRELSSLNAGDLVNSSTFSSAQITSHKSVYSTNSSCLFVLTIGFFLAVLFSRLRFWNKRSRWESQQKKKSYQPRELENPFDAKTLPASRVERF